MGLKLAGARLLLKGGLLNRDNYVAAMRSASVEFSDSWYLRRRLQLADWLRTNAGLAENSAAVNFPNPTADAGAAPTHWALYSSLNAGTLYATQAFAGSPAAPRLNASFGFDAGTLELAYSGSGAVTALGFKRGFESGLVSGTTYLGIFQRQPSGNNPGPIDAREGIAAATWVENPADRKFVRNNAIVGFGVQATDVPQPMWLGLFDAANAGNLLWEDQLDVTPPDPVLGATLSIPVNAISVGFAIDT